MVDSVNREAGRHSSQWRSHVSSRWSGVSVVSLASKQALYRLSRRSNRRSK